MSEKNTNNELEFFITAMPKSRSADYCLGYLGGSIFMDFDNYEDKRIRLKRISFDGYGCCDLKDQAIAMDEIDSRAFKEIIEAQLSDQPQLTAIVKKTLLSNINLIWEDALNEYGLI
jgi:hypothetical protein